jgi:hypothetical protein
MGRRPDPVGIRDGERESAESAAGTHIDPLDFGNLAY